MKSEQKDETPFWGTHKSTESARNERDVSSRHGCVNVPKELVNIHPIKIEGVVVSELAKNAIENAVENAKENAVENV